VIPKEGIPVRNRNFSPVQQNFTDLLSMNNVSDKIKISIKKTYESMKSERNTNLIIKKRGIAEENVICSSCGKKFPVSMTKMTTLRGNKKRQPVCQECLSVIF
jgi:predicted transcriptional regulator